MTETDRPDGALGLDNDARPQPRAGSLSRSKQASISPPIDMKEQSGGRPATAQVDPHSDRPPIAHYWTGQGLPHAYGTMRP